MLRFLGASSALGGPGERADSGCKGAPATLGGSSERAALTCRGTSSDLRSLGVPSFPRDTLRCCLGALAATLGGSSDRAALTGLETTSWTRGGGDEADALPGEPPALSASTLNGAIAGCCSSVRQSARDAGSTDSIRRSTAENESTHSTVLGSSGSDHDVPTLTTSSAQMPTLEPVIAS